MAKWAFITDTHAGARNDSPLFAEMQSRFYTDYFFPTLEDEEVTRIIHTGDYFDKRRAINFSSLKANLESFVEPSKDYDVHLTVGNHDTFFRSTNDVNSPALLLGDKWTIYQEPAIFEADGVRVAMVPWMNPENKATTLNWLSQIDVDLVAGHFEFAGFEMHKGSVSTEGEDANHFHKHPQIVSGHFHTQSSKGNIKYLGSAFELTWADCGDPRGFHIFDTETQQFTFYQNPIKMFYKIFYDGTQRAEAYANIKDKFVKVYVVGGKPYEVDTFLNGLKSHMPFDMQVLDQTSQSVAKDESVVLDIATLDTKSIITDYISATELDDDTKNGISKLLTEVYTEALDEC